MQCHCVRAEHEVFGTCMYSSIRAVLSCSYLTMSLLVKYLMSNSEIEIVVAIQI